MAQTDIDELLNSIKAENEVNCEKFVKAFAEITARLENMASGTETEELLKENLLELRVELESRHRFVIERLETVRDSFEVLNEKQDLLTKNSDLKIMFNILNENIDHFVQEAAEQKSMIDNLGANLSEFRNDTSKKDEIIEKVAIVKDGVDDVKRGLESSIMEVNSSLRNITKTLMTMDVTDQNDIIKRELENIYLATNAILSSLEIADQKNDDIAKNIVTKEDLINFSGKMDNSFAIVSEKFSALEGNEKVLEEIEKNRQELKAVNETITSELNDYLNSFKAVLSDCLEDISKNQPVTSPESDLTVIKKFEILDNLSKEIKAVEASINSQGENSALLMNTKFTELEGVINDFKTYFSSSNSDFEAELSSKINNLEAEIKQMPSVVLEKLDKWQDIINKTIESVNDIASFGDYKISESMSAISELKSGFDMLASDFASASSANKCQLENFEEKSANDFSELKSAFCKLSENIENFKNNIENSAIENKECLAELSGETAEKIRVMLDNLNHDDVQNGLNDLKVQIEEIGSSFEALKADDYKISESMSAIPELKTKLETLASELVSANTAHKSQLENFEEKSSGDFTELKSAFCKLSENIENFKNNIENSAIENKECLSALSGETAEKIRLMLDNLNHDDVQNGLNDLRIQIEEIGSSFEALKAVFTKVSAENVQKILENIEAKAAEEDKILQKIANVMDHNFQYISRNLEMSISDNKQSFEGLNSKVNAVSSSNTEKIVSKLENIEASAVEHKQNLEGLSSKIELIVSTPAKEIVSKLGDIEAAAIENKQHLSGLNSKLDVLSASSDTEKIVSKLENIEASALENNHSLSGLKAKLDDFSASGADKLVSKLDNLEAKIDMANVDIATELDTNSDMVKEFIDEYRHDSVKSSEEILSLSENIKNMELELVENSTKFNTALSAQLDDLNNFVQSLKDIHEKNDNMTFAAEHAEKLIAVENTLNSIREKFGEDLSVLQNKVADYSKAVADISLETKGKLGLSLEEIHSVKTELANVFEKITQSGDEFSSKFGGISEIILQKFDNLSESIDSIKAGCESSSDFDSVMRSNLLNIEDKFVELQGLLSENFEKNSQNSDEYNSNILGRIDDLKQEIGLINTDLSDIISTKTDALVDSFVPLKESIDSFMDNEFDKLVDNIKSQVELAYLNFSSDVNESLAENHDNYVHLEEAYKVLVDKFSSVQDIIRDLNENQIGLMTETIKEIDKTQSDNFERTNSLIELWQSELSEKDEKLNLRLSNLEGSLKKGFLDQKAGAEANKQEIKSAIEPLLKKDEFEAAAQKNSEAIKTLISESSADLKSEISGSFLEIKADFLTEAEKSETAINNLKAVMTDFIQKSDDFTNTHQAEHIEELVNSLSEKFDIMVMSDESELVQGMLSELHDKVDILAVSDNENRFDELEETLSTLHQKIDVLAMSDDDVKFGELEQNLNELHEKVDIIAMSNDDAKLDDLEQNLNELHQKVDIIAETNDDDKFDDLGQNLSELHEKVDIIAMTNDDAKFDDLEQNLNELHQKVDIIAKANDDDKFENLEQNINSLHEKVDFLAKTDEANHIEDLVQTLHNKVDIIAATDDSELFNEIQGIKNLINEQRKQIEDFGSEGSDLDKRLQSLLTEISNIDFEKSASDIKDSVMNSVLAVTEQITFAQETEEIKGFVEERTEEINKNLLDVKKQLCSIASGSDVWDYSYTMQDIESDIAKLRLILNDISASTSKEDLNEISKNMHKLAASVNTLHSTLTEEQINELKENVVKINEDVVSLSSRTNKLLLNSDESHKALTDGLEELNRVLSGFGNSSQSEVLEKKLDNINAAITTSVNRDNVMREVMLYLGEWIDDASEKINTIAADTANLSSINSELCYLKSMIGNADIIEAIRKKFEVQQSRIDTLEAKLDRVMDLLDRDNPEILENKVESFEAKTDLFIQKMDLFDKKIESFDKKMKGIDDKLGKLSEGIEKLASYVDED